MKKVQKRVYCILYKRRIRNTLIFAFVCMKELSENKDTNKKNKTIIHCAHHFIQTSISNVSSVLNMNAIFVVIIFKVVKKVKKNIFDVNKEALFCCVFSYLFLTLRLM